MRHGYYGGGSFIWGLMGFVGTLVVLTMIALLVVFLVKRAKDGQVDSSKTAPLPTSALQLLDERLAKGEIDVEDYLTRRSALMGEQSFKNEWVPQQSPAAPVAAPDPAAQPESENESAG